MVGNQSAYPHLIEGGSVGIGSWALGERVESVPPSQSAAARFSHTPCTPAHAFHPHTRPGRGLDLYVLRAH